MDARLFEFLLSRSIVYANIEAVRDGNDHFGLHFFFFSSTDFAPDRFAAVSLFVFSKRQSARFVQMAAIKKRISLSLSLFLASTVTFPLNRHRLHPEFLNKIYKYADKSGSAFLFRTVCARSTSCKHTFSRTRACKRSLVSKPVAKRSEKGCYEIRALTHPNAKVLRWNLPRQKSIRSECIVKKKKKKEKIKIDEIFSKRFIILFIIIFAKRVHMQRIT